MRTSKFARGRGLGWGALAFLALALGAGAQTPPTAPPQPIGASSRMATKVSLQIPDTGKRYILEDISDRDKLRVLAHQQTLRFSNSFVREMRRGEFRKELEAIAEVGGSSGADTLFQFLEGLEELDEAADWAGTVPDSEKEKMKTIQLAWTLVQLIRFGAPGFRSTSDLGGDANGFEEFLEGAQMDKQFLARVKDFEDRYENFVEVAMPGRDPGDTIDLNEAIDNMHSAIRTALTGLSPVNMPNDGLLKSFAVGIVDRFMTDPDLVWRIKPSWFSKSDASPEVTEEAGGNFISSGFQVLAWSVPRLDFGNPESALEELGKAYQVDFEIDGWREPGGAGSSFPGEWGGELTGEGMTYSADQSSWTTGPGPEVMIVENIKVTTKAIPMKMADRSLRAFGVDRSPIRIEELIKSFYKKLQAYDSPATGVNSEPQTLVAPKPPPPPGNTRRFSVPASGGSLP